MNYVNVTCLQCGCVWTSPACGPAHALIAREIAAGTAEAHELNREIADAFHRHLDECAQCSNGPFKLCPSGAALIRLSFSAKNA